MSNYSYERGNANVVHQQLLSYLS
jgi:hypothetical protein